jgi:hypothetical protein
MKLQVNPRSFSQFRQHKGNRSATEEVPVKRMEVTKNELDQLRVSGLSPPEQEQVLMLPTRMSTESTSKPI